MSYPTIMPLRLLVIINIIMVWTPPARAETTRSENALIFARTSGSIIGAAITCGIAEERALPLGRRSLDFSSKIQPDINYQLLAEAHAEGVKEAVYAARGSNKLTCSKIINVYKRFEDDMTIKQKN